MRPGTYVLLVIAPLNIVLNYTLVFSFRMGLMGAPLATGISYWLACLLLVLYAKLVHVSACWGGWSTACMEHSGTFARLAFFGFIQAGSEWWAFEIVALFAGRLGPRALAAQSIIMATDQITNTIPFGLSVVASARIGNLLGLREAAKASLVARISIYLSLVIGAVLMLSLLAARNSYPRIFTKDESVVRLTAEVMPYVALFQVSDGLNASASGVLRGLGRQSLGALVNKVAYYSFALPLGIGLAFRGWGLAGLWTGQCLALYTTGIFEWIIVAFTSWDDQVDVAHARLDSGRANT